MSNQEIAKIFYKIADMLELKNIQWKPQAYRKAARSLENLKQDVKIIYKERGIKAIEDIPCVGFGLAKKIIEHIKTGKIKELEKVKKTIPKNLTNLMEIPGMGPKRAELLYKKLKIKTIKDLKKALKQHKISKLETFGKKSEENLIKNLKLSKKSERIQLKIILPIANKIKNKLKKLKIVKKIEIAGSIRRKKPTVRDIDILISSNNSKKVIESFTKLKEVKRVLGKGNTKASVILNSRIQCDIRVVPPKSWGAALQYFTGPKEHSIELRKIAIKKGLKLSEYGLFNRKTNKMVVGKTEKEIYNKLGLNYIKPVYREKKI